MSKILECPTCASKVYVIWDVDNRYWTGRCWCCGDITFATKEEVKEEA